MDPCVLVASTCDSIPTEQIVKGILKAEEIPAGRDLGFGFTSFPWTIDTKYYKANVRVCTMGKQDIGTQEIADSVNAVIVSFDGNSLQPVDQWVAFTKEFDEAEVKLLVCDRCSSEDAAVVDKSLVSKYQVQQWCIANGFELVELNPEPLTDQSDTEDDFPETLGMARVIQALHAHMWPNLELKASPKARFTLEDMETETNSTDPTEEVAKTECKIAMVKPIPGVPLPSLSASKPNTSAPTDQPEYPSGSITSGASVDSKEVGKVTPFKVHSESPSQSTDPAATQQDVPANPESSSRDNRIDSMLEALDLMPEDNFEQLFMNLSEMKTKASNLSPSARKSYAEKMAIAFWNSIGGDPSEVDGLSSDDES